MEILPFIFPVGIQRAQSVNPFGSSSVVAGERNTAVQHFFPLPLSLSRSIFLTQTLFSLLSFSPLTLVFPFSLRSVRPTGIELS